MKTIGVTGGVGCGKSEILRRLQEYNGCRIIRTDDVANDLKEPGGTCHNDIVALLGEDVLKDGRIDRAKMANKIFADENLLDKVNAILHPAVRQYVQDVIASGKAQNGPDVLFIEAALLLECGYASESRRDAIAKAGIRVTPEYGITVDEMWYVYAPEDVRRKRLRRYRSYSDEKIDAIMASQLSETQFRAGCDFVIDNSGAVEDAVMQAEKRINEILNN